jgi:hypothetical protein
MENEDDEVQWLLYFLKLIFKIIGVVKFLSGRRENGWIACISHDASN